MTTMALSIPQVNLKKGPVMDGYLTVVQAAERLSVKRRTIIRWIEAGHLPGSTRLNPLMPRSPYRIPEASVDSLLAQRENPLALEG